MVSSNVSYLLTAVPYAAAGLLFGAGAAGVARWKPAWTNAFLLLGILGLATHLRLKGLALQSFWYDELLTIRDTRPPVTFSSMLECSVADNDMPPLFFVLSWVWLVLFGCTEFTSRLLPALLGIAGVGAMYGLGRRLVRPSTGLVAAFLTAISAFHIQYSQELRPYSLLFLETCVSFWALAVFLETPRPANAFKYFLISLALIYTHYFGLLVLLAQLAIGVLTVMEAPPARRSLLFWTGGVIGAGLALAFSFWLPHMLTELGRTSFWVRRPSADYFLVLYRTFFDFPPLAFCYAVLLGLLAVLSVTGNWRAMLTAPDRFRWVLLMLISWVLIVLLVPYAHSMNATPVTVARYFMTLLPALFLLLALAVDLIAYRPGKVLILSLITALSALGLFSHSDYYHRKTKGNWRELARLLPKEDRAFYLSNAAVWNLPQFYLDQFEKPVKFTIATPEAFRAACLSSPAPHVFWYLNVGMCEMFNDRTVLGMIQHFFQVDSCIDMREVTATRYEVRKTLSPEFEALLKSPMETWRGTLTQLRGEVERKRPVRAGKALRPLAPPEIGQ